MSPPVSSFWFKQQFSNSATKKFVSVQKRQKLVKVWEIQWNLTIRKILVFHNNLRKNKQMKRRKNAE